MAGLTAGTFDASYRRCFQLAFRVAYRILGSESESEEIAQETMTRALTRWRQVSDYPEAWVAKVAFRLAIDATRALRRRADRAELDGAGRDVNLEQRLDLEASLSRLTRRQQEVLVYRYFVDLTDAETAAALNVSVGAVKKHSARGLAALRGSLGMTAYEETGRA